MSFLISLSSHLRGTFVHFHPDVQYWTQELWVLLQVKHKHILKIILNVNMMFFNSLNRQISYLIMCFTFSGPAAFILQTIAEAQAVLPLSTPHRPHPSSSRRKRSPPSYTSIYNLCVCVWSDWRVGTKTSLWVNGLHSLWCLNYLSELIHDVFKVTLFLFRGCYMQWWKKYFLLK